MSTMDSTEFPPPPRFKLPRRRNVDKCKPYLSDHVQSALVHQARDNLAVLILRPSCPQALNVPVPVWDKQAREDARGTRKTVQEHANKCFGDFQARQRSELARSDAGVEQKLIEWPCRCFASWTDKSAIRAPARFCLVRSEHRAWGS